MCFFIWKMSAILIVFEIIVSAAKTIKYSNAEYTNASEKDLQNYLFSNSIVYGLAVIANTNDTNAVCYEELKIFESSVLQHKSWALKALDASGKQRASFIFGQNYWFGSREACETVKQPIRITLSHRFKRRTHPDLIKDVAPFNVEYRVVYLRHNSPWQIELKILTENIIHIGLCMPSSCNSKDIEMLTTNYLKETLNAEPNLYQLALEVLYVKDLKLKNDFFHSTSFRLMCTSLIFTCVMIVCASYCKRNKKTDQNKPSSLKVCDFVECFDVVENCEKLYALKVNSSNDISVINGMRTISALWITIFHVMFYLYFTSDNKPIGIAHMEYILFQVLAAAPLHVDMFFTVRLAPLYYVTICLATVLGAYINDVSVFHIYDRMDNSCTQHIWRHIFFIQSFFDHRDLCMNWTWSLACDMEFYVLTLTLLFIYAKNPNFIKNLVLVILFANISWTYYKGISTNFQFSFDVSFELGTEIYINPFIRILPYILGGVAAWFITEKKNALSLLSPKLENFIWNMTFLVLCGCSFMMYWRNITTLATSSILVFGRIMLSLAICWIIMASITGRSCWWSRILEFSIFQHTQRLSYAIYLTNPLVIILVGSSLSTSLRMETIFMFIAACGFCVIVYVISVFFSLAFEIPYCNWSHLILKHSKGTKSF